MRIDWGELNAADRERFRREARKVAATAFERVADEIERVSGDIVVPLTSTDLAGALRAVAREVREQ